LLAAEAVIVFMLIVLVLKCNIHIIRKIRKKQRFLDHIISSHWVGEGAGQFQCPIWAVRAPKTYKPVYVTGQGPGYHTLRNDWD